jgi:hypothetical protein
VSDKEFFANPSILASVLGMATDSLCASLKTHCAGGLRDPTGWWLHVVPRGLLRRKGRDSLRANREAALERPSPIPAPPRDEFALAPRIVCDIPQSGHRSLEMIVKLWTGQLELDRPQFKMTRVNFAAGSRPPSSDWSSTATRVEGHQPLSSFCCARIEQVVT